MEPDKNEEQIGGIEKITLFAKEGRSFKDVVEGRPQQPKGDDRIRRLSKELEDAEVAEDRRQLEKVKLRDGMESD